MRLYYTVISQEGASQASPLDSLGGFCSSSPVQSGNFNAMFGDVSMYTLQRKNKEYVALMLKNELGYNVRNLKLYITPDPEPVCGMRLAVVWPNENNEMEAVSSPNSRPLQAEFYEATEDEPIEIEGVFSDGALLGLWIERRILSEAEQVVNSSDCNYLYEKFKKDESLPVSETYNIHIDWED